MKFQYTVRLTIFNKETRQPYDSDSILVKLYDSDLVDDDFLGQGRLNTEGVTEISFSREDFVSADSPFEKKPDLYFVVMKYGELLYKSKIMRNMDMEKSTETGAGKGKITDLGIFEI